MPLRPYIILCFLCTMCYSPAYSQGKDSIKSNQVEKKIHVILQFTIPVALIGLGIWGTTDNNFINHDQIRRERFEHFPGFAHKADNYLQFAPILLTYSMDILGKGSKNNLKRQTVLLGTSQLVMLSMVYPLKKFTHMPRPDSSSDNSFPSGHTAQAFLAATFFGKEYGKSYPLLTVGMYTLATGIAVFRILNNKHWISDVLAGAGIGILSVELAYLLDNIYRKRSSRIPLSIQPLYNSGHIGFSLRLEL